MRGSVRVFFTPPRSQLSKKAQCVHKNVSEFLVRSLAMCIQTYPDECVICIINIDGVFQFLSRISNEIGRV